MELEHDTRTKSAGNWKVTKMFLKVVMVAGRCGRGSGSGSGC